jgi:hypothetical protein
MRMDHIVGAKWRHARHATALSIFHRELPRLRRGTTFPTNSPPATSS